VRKRSACAAAANPGRKPRLPGLQPSSPIIRPARRGEAGIHEVVTFHSSDEDLLPYQRGFAFDVVGDPEKELYRRYGVDASIWVIRNPKGWHAAIRGDLRKKPVLSGNPK
jgi:hypothetical protein